MAETITTQKLSLAQCRDYIRKNSKKIRKGFWVVKNDLKVWKVTCDLGYEEVVVALRVPAGTTVFVQEESNLDYQDARKMRASMAFVEKQFRIGSMHLGTQGQKNIFSWRCKEINEIYRSCSRTYDFWYETGKIVTPKLPFSMRNEQCASGIHFFVNLYDALTY